MTEKLKLLAREYEMLHSKMQDPEILGDPKQIAKIGKRLKQLEPLLPLLREYEHCREAVTFAQEATGDPEFIALARKEAEEAAARIPLLEEQMRAFLVPRDPHDDHNVILEVRAGTGGEEAALFAADLLRMYLRYAEEKGWKTELLDRTDAGGGGVKEAVVRIDGPAFGDLKFESGVHRVQRIPVTENKGRVHTSAATVAVLPEAEEVDISIRPQDLKIDTFRASGAGGQHVNKTESAIRITHIPTGTVVACQTERSQIRNRELAMHLLRSRIYQAEQDRLQRERGEMRSGQVGSGDRSEKIRTYNFPQDRVTDHRINENFSNLPAIMDGEIGEIVEALRKRDQEERIASIRAENE
ncbi:MAG: peptide chain release factor 1 [Candidatus Peribacteraceae bacterium]|nr:peptide chain release factor 1 [Candidatus Peribacteraceae bacterium]